MNDFAKIARWGSGLVLAGLLTICASSQTIPESVGRSSKGLPPALVNVGFEPTLNAQLPLDLPFRDESGRNVQLRDYFGKKPVLLAFVYYGCPMLCSQVQQGIVSSMKMVSFTPGRDYEVVFISFDSRETPDMAMQKKQVSLERYGRPETANGWHFLTGPEESVVAATKAANFRYTFDAKTNLFAHASGLMLLTPDGRISRYFYGVEYPTRDLRLGLVDASAGKIGTAVDHVLLFCYQYDPTAATYSTAILKLIRLGGVLTVLAIVGGILIFRRRDVNSTPRKFQGAH